MTEELYALSSFFYVYIVDTSTYTLSKILWLYQIFYVEFTNQLF